MWFESPCIDPLKGDPDLANLLTLRFECMPPWGLVILIGLLIGCCCCWLLTSRRTMNQPVMTNNQQVIVAGGHTMLKEPPGCCCKFWLPCCAVFCHEGCTCNLCGVIWIPCFAMCCWVRSLPLAIQPQNHIKVFCCLLIKLFQVIMQRALQQHSLSRSALHH